MKSILFAIMSTTVITLLVSLSCFTDRDDSIVTITLGDPPPGSIVRVHIAAYSGSIQSENIVYANSFNVGTVAQLQVPSGTEQYFVVIGEDNTGHATYLGSSGPYNLEAGSSEFVTVNVSAITMNVTNATSPIITGNSLVGADGYDFIVDTFQNSIYYVVCDQIESASCDYSVTPGGSDNYGYRAYFKAFNLYTTYDIDCCYF